MFSLSCANCGVHEAAALLITPAIAAIINSTVHPCEADDRANTERLSQEEFEKLFGDEAKAIHTLKTVGLDGCVSIKGFNGDAYPLGQGESSLTKYFENDNIAYIYAEKDADLFSTQYASFDELVKEFVDKLAGKGFNVPEDMVRTSIYEILGCLLA